MKTQGLGGSGSGSGAEQYGDLTDASSVNLPVDNTPLATALGLKADILTGATLGSGTTAITRATHANRPNRIAQTGQTFGTFAATATSGALAGDSFELLNTSTGRFFAQGTISAGRGMKLWVDQYETFTAVYDATLDAWYSTTEYHGSSLYSCEVSSFGPRSFGDNQYNALGTISPTGIDSSTFGAPSTANGSYGFWHRVRKNSAAAAANRGAGEICSSANMNFRLDSAGNPNGRFPIRIPFAIGNGTGAACRVFVGITTTPNSSDYTADPSARSGVDSFFVGADAADTNLYVGWNDNASTPTKSTLGASFPKTVDIPYTIVIDRTPAGVPYVTIWNRSNDAVTTVIMNDANAPRTTVTYGAQILVGTGTDATTAACDIGVCVFGGVLT